MSPTRTPPPRSGPRVNEDITASSIRCIDENGEQLGVISLTEALERAVEAGLDLVEVQPMSDPPVCKILDYGKYKYEAQKRANEARKKQKIVYIKEVKFRPNIDEHDYQVKMRNVRKFIEAGDKVKITLRFRGREMAHQELGAKLLTRVREEMEELTRIEAMPKLEGRQMVMVLAPA